jgi:anti-anti-sigma regulatory factor
MDSEGARCGELSMGWEPEGDDLRISLRGVVDGAAARTVCEHLADAVARCRDRIVLDLSGVQDISGFGAALLSHGLRSHPGLLAKLSVASASQSLRRTLGRLGVGPPD